MPLFFFLSGLLSKANIEFSKFTIHKLKHIILPFFLFWLFSITIRVAFLCLTQGNYSWRNFLSPSFSNVPLWFLPVLFFVSLISYFIERKGGRIVNIFLVLVGIIIFGKYHVFSYLEKVLYCLSFFVCGHYFMKFINEVKRAKLIILIYSVTIFYLGIYLSKNYPFRLDIATARADGGGILHFFVASAGIALITFLSMMISEKRYIIIKYLEIVGQNSLYIFAFHWIFIQPILLLYPQQKIHDFGLILTCFLIIISMGLGKILKKLLPLIFR